MVIQDVVCLLRLPQADTAQLKVLVKGVGHNAITAFTSHLVFLVIVFVYGIHGKYNIGLWICQDIAYLVAICILCLTR